MDKIVIASGNAGKLREFARLLAPFGFEAVAQSTLGVSEADEPHATFVENALAKARHASRATELPALADDSGLCALALGGGPGVQSARYAGPARDDAKNNAKLVAALACEPDKRAFYHCALVLVRHAEDPIPLIAEADWHGRIVAEPRGQGGFGYDPHFFVDSRGCTAAELSYEVKNAISHRGIALQRLAVRLGEVSVR